MPKAVGNKKQCSACKRVKHINDYNVHSCNLDGLKYQCRKCEHKYQTSERGKAAKHKYRHSKSGQRVYEHDKTSGRKAARDKKYRQTQKGKARMARAQRKYRAKNWQKNRARGAVGDAVRQGDIPRVSSLICECGNQAICYHHYKGYKKENWLDVLPLCQGCHLKHHDRHFRKALS